MKSDCKGSREELFSWFNAVRGERCALWADSNGTLAASVDRGSERIWLTRDKFRNLVRPDAPCDARLEMCIEKMRDQRGLSPWVLLHHAGNMFIGPPLTGGVDPQTKRNFLFPADWDRARAHRASGNTYRKELIKFFGYEKSDVTGFQAHHSVARAVESRMSNLFSINIHAPFFTSWVTPTHHRSFTREHLEELLTWIADNPNGTPAQLHAFIVDRAGAHGYQIGSFPG